MTTPSLGWEPATETGTQLPPLRLVPPVTPGRPVKRGLDVLLAVTLLAVLAPVLLLIAALVASTSPGPVFYRQRRVGRWGDDFELIKFRSMYVGSDRLVAAYADHNEADGPLFKMRCDPRVTRVGRLIRRLSLDELPQLFNVLGGSMSLVGPRPALPTEAATYDDRAVRRLEVRPGLTGLWQVSGRSDLGWQEGLELDLRYVEEGGTLLDLAILLRTLPAVITGRGAY